MHNVTLDAAFADRSLVKATLLRITSHVVHADDYPALRAAMRPTLRGAGLGDRRFTASGLTTAEADAVVPELLAFTEQPRTAPEVEARLAARLDVPPKGVRWALRTFAPLRHAGVWRPVVGGIEATAFHPLGDEAWQGLAVEARSLPGFLADREPAVHRRYDRWWADLPAAEVRVLPGG